MLYFSALVLMLIGGAWFRIKFLPMTESGSDGFQEQLEYIVFILQDGTLGEEIAENWLLLIHVGRLLVVTPFLALEKWLGPIAQLCLLLLTLLPLVRLTFTDHPFLVSLLPLLLPFAVSGRSVLVTAGVAYIILFMLSERGRPWMLWFGLLAANLSSASVLIALLLLLFSQPLSTCVRRHELQRGLAIILLLVSFFASAADKFTGFQTGEAGYESTVSSGNPLLAALSRSTLIVSFEEGQYLRAVVYTVVAIYLLSKVAMLMAAPEAIGRRRMMLCCLPGIFLEGLGVLAMGFPLYWLLIHFDPSDAMTNRQKGVPMILLVAYGGGHVALLAPVALALQKKGRPFTFLALTTAGAYLDRINIPYIGFLHLDGAQDADVQTYGEALAQYLPAGGPVSREETVAYLGLNYRELVREHGQVQAQKLFQERGRQAFLPIHVFERLLENLKPALVVATNSPRSERSAILAARRIGIPSICAVDIFALQEVQWIGVPGYADKVCVLNEQVRQMLIEHGRKPEEVVVTGNPAFDRLTTAQAVEAGAQLRQDRSWNDDFITILWASQIEPERHPFTDSIGDSSLPRRIEAYLREFVAVNEGFRLVVRYHPSEHEIFTPGLRVEFSPIGEDLGALLHAVDVVVVTASTVGLEASLAGRSVISVDASIFTADAPYSEMGISTGVKIIKDIGPLLHKLAVTYRRGKLRESTSLASKMTATQKVMQVIDSLL